MDIKAELEEKGYAIIPNILSEEEIVDIKGEFATWQKVSGAKPEIHGIIKHYQVGNTRHAWKIRTNPKVQEAFAEIWDTDINNLVVSQDGTNWINADCKSKDSIWTHTDQAPIVKGRVCVQGFVALTSNKERTLVVHEGSHLLHEKYFEKYEVKDTKKIGN